MRKMFAVAAMCFSFAQIQDERCKVFCRSAAGYDSGIWVESTQKCWCADQITDERLHEKRVKLPGIRGKIESHAMIEPTIVPRRLPWEFD